MRWHRLEGREEAENGEGEERKRGGADEDRSKRGHGGAGWGAEEHAVERATDLRRVVRRVSATCAADSDSARLGMGASEFHGPGRGAAESVSRAGQPGLRLALRERSRVALAR